MSVETVGSRGKQCFRCHSEKGMPNALQTQSAAHRLAGLGLHAQLGTLQLRWSWLRKRKPRGEGSGPGAALPATHSPSLEARSMLGVNLESAHITPTGMLLLPQTPAISLP